MPDTTTLVSSSRLKDFELFTGRIGSLVSSYSSEAPSGCLYIGVQNTEVSKTVWAELYDKIGGADGTQPGTFVLPYKADEGSLKYYIVGKVLISDVVASGNVVSQTFSFADLDSSGYYTFNHGIDHTNPIIQVRDENNGMVLIPEIINTIGKSKLKIEGTYRGAWVGSWKALAIG
ncbi:MAG: hypothetical protein J6Z11_07310 [Candidatus Riflebacteria bacterium]|nr:hypothetical protein [Candidatus Riflebacteria bacterium]